MDSDLWKLIASPAGLLLVIFSGLFGALVKHLLSQAAKKKEDALRDQREKQSKQEEDRKRLIRDIADKYLSIPTEESIAGIPNLIRAGITQVDTLEDLRSVTERIKHHGDTDPLSWIHDQLREDEILPFIKWQAAHTIDMKPYYIKAEFTKLVQKFRS